MYRWHNGTSSAVSSSPLGFFGFFLRATSSVVVVSSIGLGSSTFTFPKRHPMRPLLLVQKYIEIDCHFVSFVCFFVCWLVCLFFLFVVFFKFNLIFYYNFLYSK
uniref:Transmembrane protein n=1 Tax=Cacopsylla melanoneura TaxID=428564 RepID=A0A8D8PSM6_9HEMI